MLSTQDPAAEGSGEELPDESANVEVMHRLSEHGIAQLSRTATDDLMTMDSDDASGGSEEITLTLCLLSIDRYTPDQTAEKLLQLSDENEEREAVGAGHYADLFDVTLTDGTLKRKCLLHPTLNNLVYVGRLMPGRVVKVVRWCHWFDETVIGGEGIIILTKLNCTLTSIDITPSNTIAFAEQAVSRERSASPLIGTRGYYLHASNDTCLYGRNWGRLENEPKGVRDLDLNQGKEDEEEGERKGEGGEGEGEEGARRRDQQRWHGRLSISDEELELLVDLPMDEFLRVGSQETEAEAEEDEHGRGNLYTIAEVFSEHESMGGGQRAGAGPFIARVVQKSKVIHYAKVSDSNAKYPMRCQLVVRDRTGSATVVLWTNMCAYYYPHLEIGDLVLIGKYKIKPAYPHPHGPPWELALNAGTAFLFKLSASQWPRIPRISYDLVTSSELDKGVEDGGAFDYLGRVIFAGRQERSRKVLEWGSGGVSPRGCSGGFRHYRWLLLQDVSSLDAGGQQTSDSNMRTRGLLVKLYTNSQDFARFEDLQEGHVVLLTDLKLLVLTNDNDAEAADDSERQGRPPPVSARSITLSRSTNFTQIYIFDQSPAAGGDDAVEAHVRDVQARYPLSIWHRSVQEQVAKTLRWNAIADSFYAKLLDTTRAINEQFSLLPVSTVFLRPWPLPFFQRTHPHVTVHTLRDVATVSASLHQLERASLLVQGRIVRLRSFYPRQHDTADHTAQFDEGEGGGSAISRKRKLVDVSVLLDFKPGKATLGPDREIKKAPKAGPSGASSTTTTVTTQVAEVGDGDGGMSGLPCFPTTSLPASFDGLLPTVALSIDIESLNRNATCDNVVLVVPLDIEASTRVVQRKRRTRRLGAGHHQTKRPRLDASDDDKGKEQQQQEEDSVVDDEADSPTSWSDDEKEEIALMSLVRYLALQSLVTPDEHAELRQRLAQAATRGNAHERQESTQAGKEEDEDAEGKAGDVGAHEESSDRRGHHAGWPGEEVRRWLAQAVGRDKRFVFLLELYARPGQLVEKVATALFPPTAHPPAAAQTRPS